MGDQSIADFMRDFREQHSSVRNSYLEMMACAYCYLTGIDPSEAVLVETIEYTDKGMVISWHYARQEDYLGE